VKLIRYRSSIASGVGDFPSSLPLEAVGFPSEFRSDAVVEETGLNDRNFFASNVAMLPELRGAKSNFETDIELVKEKDT